MKKIIIVVSVLLGTILMYLVGEQVYLYYKNDKQNVWFLFRNYSQHESVHMKMLIDGNEIYDIDATKDLPITYIETVKVPVGVHSLEIIIDGQSLYKGKIKTLLNRYIIAEYYGNNAEYYGNDIVDVLTSPRFIRDL